ncbi:hypothetical protein LSM04_006896 [Trypanosoma melophagium]|uniref:uncharacterized protein n=1 Tax=Trypanosoma melophagium TaxID=715481 RepID=UPI00351A8E07|nr:hypothetical protein LSM04_006896 [Trypanosoma melophagium]
MQGDARRLDGTFLNQELKRRTTSTQRNRMWDPSSRSSGDNKNINKNMSISNRNTVDNRQARSSLILVERPLNVSDHQRQSQSCVLQSECQRKKISLPVDKSSSSSQESLSLISSHWRNKEPVFCLPHYRWTPLHTAYSHGLVREHDDLIQWFTDREEKKQKEQFQIQHKECNNHEIDSALIAWIEVAESRCDALELFIQEHRTLYGNLDAEKLLQVEACYYRLMHSLRKAREQQQQQQQKRLLASGLSMTSILDAAKSASRPLVAHAKHISFARPLFHYFSSTTSTTGKNTGDSMNELVELAHTTNTTTNTTTMNEAADGLDCCGGGKYMGRTSGVYYGGILQSDVSSTPISQKSRAQSEVLTDGDCKQNLEEISPGKLVPTFMMVEKLLSGQRKPQQRKSFKVGVVLLAFCCLAFLTFLWWWLSWKRREVFLKKH